MANLSEQRAEEFLHEVYELLLDKPEGLSELAIYTPRMFHRRKSLVYFSPSLITGRLVRQKIAE